MPSVIINLLIVVIKKSFERYIMLLVFIWNFFARFPISCNHLKFLIFHCWVYLFCSFWRFIDIFLSRLFVFMLIWLGLNYFCSFDWKFQYIKMWKIFNLFGLFLIYGIIFFGNDSWSLIFLLGNYGFLAFFNWLTLGRLTCWLLLNI